MAHPLRRTAFRDNGDLVFEVRQRRLGDEVQKIITLVARRLSKVTLTRKYCMSHVVAQMADKIK